VNIMNRWVKGAALVLVATAAIWGLLAGKGRRDRARTDSLPMIGGDTWPPVPINPSRTA
jgi:hypothetical protein